MARVIGNPFGELAGKLAGNVFSRNKSGAIVREYVIPSNPNTAAQMASRSCFRSASQGWSALTQIIQQTWNLFATATYNPLRKVNNGQFTGNRSYVAIKNSVNNATLRTFTTTWTFTGPAVPPLGVPEPFVAPELAPLSSVAANIKQGLLSPATMNISAVSISKDLEVEIDLMIGNIGPSGLAGTTLKDANGKLFTFATYMSDPVKTIGGRPKNKFFARIGNCDLNDYPVATIEDTTAIKYAYNAGALIVEYKQMIQEGSIVLVTVVGLGKDGTQVVIGEMYTTIVA